MKKEYKDLELEIVNFAAEDVITTSVLPPCKNLGCSTILQPCPHEAPCPFGCECDGGYACNYSPAM